MNSFTIQLLHSGDIDQLQSMSRSTFENAFAQLNTPENMQLYMDRAFSRPKLLEELNAPDCAFYLAYRDAMPIGYFKLNWNLQQTDAHDPNALEIERIYVLSAYQGTGIGKTLLEKIYDIAHAKGFKRIWLGVWEKNEGAIRFYQRNGFSIFGSHVFMLGNDRQTDLLMHKQM